MKDPNRKPSMAAPMVFFVLSVIVFAIVVLLSASILNLRIDAANSEEAGAALGLGLGAIIFLPIGLIALGVGTLFSGFSFGFFLRFAIKSMEKRRVAGIVFTVLSGVILLGGIAVFFGSWYVPI
ncbi:MAG: hypothetical protein MJ082_01625 [Clostridia bacterium]|nr:hypothetical protein [Clostridia bacterium]